MAGIFGFAGTGGALCEGNLPPLEGEGEGGEVADKGRGEVEKSKEEERPELIGRLDDCGRFDGDIGLREGFGEEGFGEEEDIAFLFF